MYNESLLKQKSKSKWLRRGGGGRELRFKIFHIMVIWRRGKNMIRGVNVERTWMEDPKEVKEKAWKFFKNRFCEEEWDR